MPDMDIRETGDATGVVTGDAGDVAAPASSYTLSRRLFTHPPLAPVYVSIIVFFFVISRQLPIFLYLIK